MKNNTPIIYIDYVTEENGTKYIRTEWENGYVESVPRDVWIEAYPNDRDMWRSGPNAALYGAARREAELTKG